jgi:hypothetical protein
LDLSDLIRVRKWTEFKRLVKELKPDSIVYSIDQNAMSKTKELTCLRLILSAPDAYYVYVDFPKGNVMRDTGIHLHETQNGRFLEDQDIIDFLKQSLGRADLAVFSYWTA